MTCRRSTGMTDLWMPPSRAMRSACSWALSPSTSLTSNEDVEGGLWAALDAGTSRAHATARRAMTTTVRFTTGKGLAVTTRMDFPQKLSANELTSEGDGGKCRARTKG